jgi:hypothetical protein
MKRFDLRVAQIHLGAVRAQVGAHAKPLMEQQNSLTYTTTKQNNSGALVRQSDRRLSAKLVPTFADRGCRVVSATDPHGRIIGFLDRSRYFSIQVASQLYSRG